jgi:SAM-dependent methyltransferase
MPAGDETFSQPDYFVKECDECGLLFRTPTLSPAELDRYYAKFDFRAWEHPGFHPTERAVLEILRAMPPDSAVLDFGCSSGRLLAPLISTHRCYGIELNAAAADEAAKKGITMLEGIDAAEMRFDAIVLVDVFEHLAHPLGLLTRLSAQLSDRGLLIVVTGNGDAAVCRRDPALFWYFRILQHLCMLTAKHAQFIASRLGLRIAHWIKLGHYDLSARVRFVQALQNFLFWQFRKQTFLARGALRFLPGMRGLKAGTIAPTYTCSKDHVVVVFAAKNSA